MAKESDSTNDLESTLEKNQANRKSRLKTIDFEPIKLKSYEFRQFQMLPTSQNTMSFGYLGGLSSEREPKTLRRKASINRNTAMESKDSLLSYKHSVMPPVYEPEANELKLNIKRLTNDM